jgi:TonB family protein
MKNIIHILFISFVFYIISCSVALADEKLPDISKMSAEEINKLPNNVISRLPAKDLLNFSKGKNSGLVIPYIFANLLGQLGYLPPPTETQIREAVKRFQRDIDQQETGELTIGQFEELELRSTRFTDTPVYLPAFGDELKVYGYPDLVRTEGTWKIEGERIFNPINYSEISCIQSQGTCEVFQAYIDIPTLKDRGVLGQVEDSYALRITKDTFKVMSWTDSEVISQTGSECRSTIMTINIKNNEVFQITRNKGNVCDFGIAKLPKLDKPRISKLIPGYNFSYEFWRNRKKETRKYLSSEYLKFMKEKFKHQDEAKEKTESADAYLKSSESISTTPKSKYVKLVQEKIYKNWSEPLAEEHNQETIVSFIIFPGGNIDKPFIKKSSGVEALDTLAVKAVLDSAPFPEFPKELNMPNLHINIYFKYIPKDK